MGRAIIPFLLLSLLVVNCLLLSGSMFFRVFLLMQIGFYSTAIIGSILGKLNKKNRLLFVPFYFCVTNLAILLGIVKFFKGRDERFWEPLR